jgi:hypothetical protein
MNEYYRVGALYSGAPYELDPTCSPAPVGALYAYYDLSPFAVASFQSGTASVSSMAFDGVRGGSRIELTTVTSPDGARTASRWHDTALGIDCYFGLASDGTTRCLPWNFGYVEPYFADASCTQQLAIGVGCDVPVYAESLTGCTSYYTIGAPYSGTVYYNTGTSCITTTAPQLALYTLGAQVLASTFQGATLSH